MDMVSVYFHSCRFLRIAAMTGELLRFPVVKFEHATEASDVRAPQYVSGGAKPTPCVCMLESLSESQNTSAPHCSLPEPKLAARTAAACSATSSACLRCLGDDGGENVGDGEDGVGGRLVSRHTRWVVSLRPSAAARVSRSSSAAESEVWPAPSPFVACCASLLLALRASSFRCRLGDDGGEQVGDGERGVGGSERSSAAACIAPRSCPFSRK